MIQNPLKVLCFLDLTSNYKHQNLSEVKAKILCKIQQQCLWLTKKKKKFKNKNMQLLVLYKTHHFFVYSQENNFKLKNRKIKWKYIIIIFVMLKVLWIIVAYCLNLPAILKDLAILLLFSFQCMDKQYNKICKLAHVQGKMQF